MRVVTLIGLGLLCGACDPCAPDEHEPNDGEGDAAFGGTISFDLVEQDVNFDDQSDVDCFAYEIPEPISPEPPVLYLEIKGGNREDVSGTFAFECNSGDPTELKCNGEDLTDPPCAVEGTEPSFRVTYDCNGDEEGVGDASIVVCLTRPTPDKLCVDYTLRAYLN